MKQKYLSYLFSITAIIMIIFAIGCFKEQEEPIEIKIEEKINQDIKNSDVAIEEIGTEYIGGKYNLTLINTKYSLNNRTSTVKKIQYFKDGELINPDQILPDNMRSSLDWLKSNTPEDTIIMAWWDYGNIIRAYAEREPVLDAPSKEILVTTVSKHLGKSPEEIDCPNCASHNIIQDVSRLLLSRNSSKPIEIIKKYSADYLYIHIDDESKSAVFYITLNEEPKPISSTILEKAIGEENIDGFELVYSDEVARIYRSINP